MGSEFELPQVIDNSKGQNQTQVELAEHLHSSAYSNPQRLGRAVADALVGQASGVAAGVESAFRKIDTSDVWGAKFNSDWLKPTPEETKEAKQKLDSHVSELIPDKTQCLLKDMQHRILDGDLSGLERDISQFRGDPAALKAFVKELDKNLAESHAGVSLAVSSDGNVLVYKNFGSAAVEISPWTGGQKIRPIKNSFDGTVILEPGEVLNKDARDLMQEIGNHAVNRINDPPLIRSHIFDPEVTPPKWPITGCFPWSKENPGIDIDPGFSPKLRPMPDIDPGFSPKWTPMPDIDPGFSPGRKDGWGCTGFRPDSKFLLMKQNGEIDMRPSD